MDRNYDKISKITLYIITISIKYLYQTNNADK